MPTRAISGSRASSCKELRDFSVHVRTTVRTANRGMTKGVYGSLVIPQNTHHQRRRAARAGIAVRKFAMLLAADIAKRTPKTKKKTASCMKMRRSSNQLGMAHRLRPCAYNSRFLASSSGLWCVSQLSVWLDSQCFKYRAWTLINRTVPKLVDNHKTAINEGPKPSGLGSGREFEVLRSWLEMSFNMMTILPSLSLGVASWRMKPI